MYVAGMKGSEMGKTERGRETEEREKDKVGAMSPVNHKKAR